MRSRAREPRVLSQVGNIGVPNVDGLNKGADLGVSWSSLPKSRIKAA